MQRDVIKDVLSRLLGKPVDQSVVKGMKERVVSIVGLSASPMPYLAACV